MLTASIKKEVQVFDLWLTGWSCLLFKVDPKMNSWTLQMDGLAALKESLNNAKFISSVKINVSGV